MSAQAFSLVGKVAVVAGAAGGIGSSIARRLADAGAKVACVDRRAPDALARAISETGGDALALGCDITRVDDAGDRGSSQSALGPGGYSGQQRFRRRPDGQHPRSSP